MRKHGLAIDNLVGADVVTADGRFVHASATEEPELFWGLRGGGGNFGIVTAFEFELHNVGPMVYGGPIFFAGEDAEKVLQRVRATGRPPGCPTRSARSPTCLSRRRCRSCPRRSTASRSAP